MNADFDPRTWFESLPDDEQAQIVAIANHPSNQDDIVVDAPPEWDGVWPAK